MKNATAWKPTKFEVRAGRLRGTRDVRELGAGSRLISDLVAALYQEHLPLHARGRLLDLGCGKAPLYGTYAPWVSEVVCLDWADSGCVDLVCDLTQPLPLPDARFDTVVFSDVLEHMPDPMAIWREMCRVLAPGGRIVLNVPFYYSVHAHPHDYYRYTRFALQRFAAINGLQTVHLVAVGGLVEILADLMAKALSKLPLLGRPLAVGLQAVSLAFVRTKLGARLAERSAWHFPLGYFMVVERPAQDTA